MDKEELIHMIVDAFDTRVLPGGVLATAIAGDDDLPEGHPGVGKGNPIPENYTDFILRNIEGKTWQDVNAKDLDWSIHFMSLNALCYYIPAILIHNLQFNNSITSIEIYLTGVPAMAAERTRIRDALTGVERHALAEFVVFTNDIYSEEVLQFWQDGLADPSR